ncbi:hypothetical protein HGRIS_014729 [Hohenbuehelia grisea]|uniref:Heterokaryon incompatibility domain-containing protein n=1 Tax=Hohenbuehelia grisea TaxID=104357 RepID=A0ABR3IQP7_9AGAR
MIRLKVEDFFRDRPVRLIRLADMMVLTRNEIINDTIEQIVSDLPAGFKLDDLTLHLAHKCAYAILSHRWGRKELTLSDALKLHDTPGSIGASTSPQSSPALRKILTFCTKAKEYGCRYAWFDSGCIDQSSEAELAESIPAMYHWYQNATVCIVHLASIHTGTRVTHRHRVTDDEWFGRGWTLQEFLASRRIKFYDAGWQPLTNDRLDIDRATSWVYIVRGSGEISAPLSGFNDSTKANIKLPKVFAGSNLRATDLDRAALQVDRPPGVENAGPMIYWMASRATTQPEDRVYALMGLLNLRLPISYGEGFDNALLRLQIAILHRTTIIQPWLWTGTPIFSIRALFVNSKEALGGKIIVLDGALSSRGTAPGADRHTLPMKSRMKMTIYPIHILQAHHPPTSPKSVRIRTPDDLQLDSDSGEPPSPMPNLVLGIIDSALDKQLDESNQSALDDLHTDDRGARHCYAFMLQKRPERFPFRASYSRLARRPVAVLPRVPDGSCGLLRAARTVYVI